MATCLEMLNTEARIVVNKYPGVYLLKSRITNIKKMDEFLVVSNFQSRGRPRKFEKLQGITASRLADHRYCN